MIVAVVNVSAIEATSVLQSVTLTHIWISRDSHWNTKEYSILRVFPDKFMNHLLHCQVYVVLFDKSFFLPFFECFWDLSYLAIIHL